MFWKATGNLWRSGKTKISKWEKVFNGHAEKRKMYEYFKENTNTSDLLKLEKKTSQMKIRKWLEQ